MIYLDNAATSYQKPEAVYQAVQEAAEELTAHPWMRPGRSILPESCWRSCSMRETHPGWRLRPIPPKA